MNLKPILIVDDEPELRELMVEALRADGYQAEGAPDAEAALQKIQDVSQIKITRVKRRIFAQDEQIEIEKGKGFGTGTLVLSRRACGDFAAAGKRNVVLRPNAGEIRGPVFVAALGQRPEQIKRVVPDEIEL